MEQNQNDLRRRELDLHTYASQGAVPLRRSFLKALGALAILPALPGSIADADAGGVAFFVPNNPTSGEELTYSRHPWSFWWNVNSFTWRWKFAGVTFGAWPPVRLLVDGQPATPWLRPAGNAYDFQLNVPNGHHIVAAELQPGVIAFAKGFIVNSTGKRLATQKPWTATDRFEVTNGKMEQGYAQLTYPGRDFAPVRYPLKPRPANPFNGVFLPKSERWARRLHTNVTNANMRRFVEIPTGDIDIEVHQKYFYDQAISQGFTRPPKTCLRDGPLGVGALGYLYKGIMNPSDQGMYWSDTNGRLGFLWRDGKVTTLLGWRLKADEVAAHAGIANVMYQYAKGSTKYRPQDQDFYDSKWEYVGDWSRVPDPKRFNEPWGFAAFGGHHEFWVCDTLNHRILYANHYTSHPADMYSKPQFPPRGYTAPASPTGQTQVVPFILGPSNLVKEPWDCAMRDGKLYWTNFAGNSICRANLDGSNPEVVLQSSVNPTDAALGCGSRLAGGFSNVSHTRAAYIIDGPVGKASCVRPQGMAFDSQGNLVWGERYTFAIRKLNLATKMVTTVTLIGGNNRNDKTDISLAIDTQGDVGPVDDIFVTCWKNGDYRYAKDGTFRERFLFQSGMSLRNGPGDKIEGPEYAWAIAIGHGRLIATGSAGGSQCVEITKRLATDPQPDVKRFAAGKQAYTNGNQPPMQLTHGPMGEGELGLPTIDEMGSWDDAKLRAYGLANGIPAGAISDWMYWVRWSTIDQDYSASPL